MRQLRRIIGYADPASSSSGSNATSIKRAAAAAWRELDVRAAARSSTKDRLLGHSIDKRVERKPKRTVIRCIGA